MSLHYVNAVPTISVRDAYAVPTISVYAVPTVSVPIKHYCKDHFFLDVYVAVFNGKLLFFHFCVKQRLKRFN